MKKKKLKKRIRACEKFIDQLQDRIVSDDAQIEKLKYDLKEEKQQKELWIQRCKQIRDEEKRKYEMKIFGGY